MVWVRLRKPHCRYAVVAIPDCLRALYADHVSPSAGGSCPGRSS